MTTASALLQSHVHCILHTIHNFKHPVTFTCYQRKDLSGAPTFEKVFVTPSLICNVQSPSPRDLLTAFPKHLCSNQTNSWNNEDLLDGAKCSRVPQAQQPLLLTQLQITLFYNLPLHIQPEEKLLQIKGFHSIIL